MELSVQQIKDYNYCPRLYKLTHIDKFYDGKVTTIENFFEKCIKQTVYWFFYNIQDGTIPSLKELKSKFGDLYIGDRTVGQTMFLGIAEKNIARLLENKGVAMLTNFYEKYKKDHGVPILISKDFRLNINDTIVTGTIPIIRENSKHEIEMLSFFVDSSKGSKTMLHEMIKYDISITTSSLAFKTLFGRTPDTHRYYTMRADEERLIMDKIEHYRDATYMIDSVSTAIKNKLFHPVYNNNCISCTYNKICIRN